jgi:hypothetical protein
MIPRDGDTFMLGVGADGIGVGTEGVGLGGDDGLDINALLRLGLREKLLREDDDELRGMIST